MKRNLHVWKRITIGAVSLAMGLVSEVCHGANDTNAIPASADPVENEEALAQTNATRSVAASTATAPVKKIKYRPPLRGSPARRVTGGSRGSGISLISLIALAPEHTGLTTREQPSLFWYQSEPAEVSFEFSIVVENQIEPLVELSVKEAKQAGIQRIRLADHGVKLESGIEYQWHVALVVDGESRSQDVIASGFIQRVEPSSELQAATSAAKQSDLPSIYGEHALWYDVIETLSDLIEQFPQEKALHAERADLLMQEGLTNAANHEIELSQ